MKLRASVRIPFSPETVFAAIRDHVTELRPYLEGIHRIRVLSRVEHDGRVETVVDWCAGTGAAAPVRAVFGEWAFAWTDYAVWDEKALTVDWRTETRALGDALTFGAHDAFIPDGAGGTLLEVDGALELDPKRIPAVPALLGVPVARRLEAYLAARVETSVSATAKAIAAYLGASVATEPETEPRSFRASA